MFKDTEKSRNLNYFCMPKQVNITLYNVFRNELLSKEWCNLIFRNRNKDYGAYVLRKNAGRRLTWALFIVAGLTLLAVAVPLAIAAYINYEIRQAGDEISKLTKMRPLDLEEEKDIKVIAAGRFIPHQQAPVGDGVEVPDIVDHVPPPLHFGVKGPETLNVDNNELVNIPDSAHNADRKDLPDEGRQLTPTQVVEEMPQFPGGIDALVRFFDENIAYPQSAIDAKKEGDLEVCFLVDRKGNVMNPKISRKLCPELDAAALDACKKMPQWKPGKVGGKVSVVQVTVPVHFQLK